jgi:hypothetical protein
VTILIMGGLLLRKEEVLFLKKKNQKNFDSAPRGVALSTSLRAAQRRGNPSS